MKIKYFLVLASVMPALAQYAGPAILSRGEAPVAMKRPDIDFRPFVEVSGVYDTGLAGVTVTPSGDLESVASYGLGVTGGVSGSHSWRHTRVGLDYRGGFNHYVAHTKFDNIDQSLMLGVTQDLSPHVSITLRQAAGMFTRTNGLLGLQQTVPFDPSTTYAPTTDYFDNRTAYLSTQADLTYQRTARLSFNLGGDGFLTERRSASLYGVVGGAARADVQYRISRHSTIGANYIYEHYGFTKIFGATDIHGAAFTFARRLTRTVELSGYAGFMRVESKFVTTVPIDPAIAAILGISGAQEVSHAINYEPNASGRLSRTFKNGVAYISGGRTVTPGNGLFLTTYATTILAGYTYTGLRRWSFSMEAGRFSGNSVGNIKGHYASDTGNMSVSRQLARSVHFIARYSIRRYTSDTYGQYNRLVHSAMVGFGFTPGDVPLRIW